MGKGSRIDGCVVFLHEFLFVYFLFNGHDLVYILSWISDAIVMGWHLRYRINCVCDWDYGRGVVRFYLRSYRKFFHLRR